MGTVKQAVIMVGGKGTRLRPLTETRPKPVLPVLDKPCLSYLIESFVRGGIAEIILACGYRSEQMEEAIGDGSDLGITIDYSYEDKPMGTAGAIKLLEDRLDDVFVAANGDVFADLELSREIEAHLDGDAAVTIALTPVENPCEFGIARLNENGEITEFREKPKPEEVFSNLINAGVYVVDREVMKYVPDDTPYDFSKELVPRLIAKGYRVLGHEIDGVWKDVGRPSDLIGANLIAAARAGGYPGTVRGTSLDSVVYVGKGSSVEGGSLVDSVVMASCEVSDSKIEGSVLFPGCKVESSDITGSVIGENCVIPEGCKIIDSVLGDNVALAEKTVMDGRKKK